MLPLQTPLLNLIRKADGEDEERETIGLLKEITKLRTTGYEWKQLKSKPTKGGVELQNPKLADALKEKQSFTQDELDTLGVEDLKLLNCIEAGGTLYCPDDWNRKVPSLDATTPPNLYPLSVSRNVLCHSMLCMRAQRRTCVVPGAAAHRIVDRHQILRQAGRVAQVGEVPAPLQFLCQ